MNHEIKDSLLKGMASSLDKQMEAHSMELKKLMEEETGIACGIPMEALKACLADSRNHKLYVASLLSMFEIVLLPDEMSEQEPVKALFHDLKRLASKELLFERIITTVVDEAPGSSK